MISRTGGQEDILFSNRAIVRRATGEMTSQNISSSVKDQLTFIKEKVVPTLWRMMEPQLDFFDIIDSPKDLFTVRDKLNFNFYQNTNECLEDIQRIIGRACLCFTQSSPALNQAKSMETALKTLIKDMPQNNPNEQTMPSTSTSQNADLPTTVEPVPDVISKAKLQHSLEKSGKEILVSKTEEASSVTQPEFVFKIPLKPAPKRKRVERCTEPMAESPRSGSAAPPSTSLVAIETSSPSSTAWSSLTNDLVTFRRKFYNKQLDFINRQMVNLGKQLKLINKNRKKGRYSGMGKLLDRQSRLGQAQKEWLTVRNLEEYKNKKKQGRRNNGDPQ